MFFNICFNQTKVGVFKLVQQAYADEDTKVAAKGEEIIGFALDYFRGLLEDPSIWTSDMIPDFGENLDPNCPEQNEQLEEFVT